VSARGVEVRLLGELEISVGGRVQALPPSKKTRALLAYLVATARPHSRERLCALLWDGPDDPRAALRWSLTKIRPLLDVGAARLFADRERVSFEAGSATGRPSQRTVSSPSSRISRSMIRDALRAPG